MVIVSNPILDRERDSDQSTITFSRSPRHKAMNFFIDYTGRTIWRHKRHGISASSSTSAGETDWG
jgi:hypothetical protein